jgi:hypothetical protein
VILPSLFRKGINLIMCGSMDGTVVPAPWLGKTQQSQVHPKMHPNRVSGVSTGQDENS